MPIAKNLHIMQVNMRKSKRASPAQDLSRTAMLATFERALKTRAFLQSDAALALGVHQGQISKVLRGDFVRSTGLPERLFEYANMRLAECEEADRQSAAVDTMMRDLVARLALAWDRTPEGARALGEILDGVARLRRP